MPIRRHFDAVLGPTCEGLLSVTSEEGVTYRFAGPHWLTPGTYGVLCVDERDATQICFHAYHEQRLRRWPEEDIAADPARDFPGAWSWKLEGEAERITCRTGFVPGLGGRYLEDSTENVDVPLPDEFKTLCATLELDPSVVLRTFIADVAGIQNSLACPREDGFDSSGDDERALARAWFQRAFGNPR